MRLFFLGAGGTGGYFGGRLAAAGIDVTFLVRERRAGQLARDGLVIESPLGDWRGSVQVVTAATLSGSYDIVVVSCKAYDLAAAIESIRPAVGPETLVLPLLNGLNHLAELDSAFGNRHVGGGLCHISLTLTDDGHIRHLNRLQSLTYGAREDCQRERCAALLPLLRRGGFDVVHSDDILQDMWDKLVFLATLAGMTCLMRASVGEIVAARDGRALTLAMLDECAAVATAAGFAPRPRHLEDSRGLLTAEGSPVVASMLRDLRAGHRVEADHIVGDIVQRADSAGVPVPLLKAAYCQLQCYQGQRQAGTAAAPRG